MGRIKGFVQLAAGRVLSLAMPRLAADVASGCESPSVNPRIVRAIRKSQARRAARSGDVETLQKLQFGKWSDPHSVELYDLYKDRFESWFLNGPQYEMVDWIKAAVDRAPPRRLVEVGCGDGRVVAHLAERFPSIEKLIGIDLNCGIIERNRRTFADKAPRLQFVSGDAVEWLAANPLSGTLLLSNGGVLEYFAPDVLKRLFMDLADSGAASIAAIEPFDPSHDLGRDPASHPFGSELSFSHNYRALVEEAGFSVQRTREADFGGAHWMFLFADHAQALARPAMFGT
ncbi:methyltransferase domain-containing protein [Rhodobacterales bacterium HKCCE3408]|nr:methyltransferase domain-containing protein [Rhodobacterales bacterium HKCCE3408]